MSLRVPFYAMTVLSIHILVVHFALLQLNRQCQRWMVGYYLDWVVELAQTLISQHQFVRHPNRPIHDSIARQSMYLFSQKYCALMMVDLTMMDVKMQVIILMCSYDHHLWWPTIVLRSIVECDESFDRWRRHVNLPDRMAGMDFW